jgi:Cys-tRNA(Pro)/Cys-tRNA(Cys) deacylase
MSGRTTRATEALARAGIPHRIHEYERPERIGPARGTRPAYGREAAAALEVDEARILKTLVATVDGRFVLAIVPVAGALDLKALAAATGGRRAELTAPAEAERVTGYVVGGISPLGGRRALPAVVDGSAMDHPTVLVSAGRRGLQLELTPSDLVRASEARVASISRPGRARAAKPRG